MSIFKCKMCGGTIEFEPGASVGICDSCGTKQTLPRLDDDRRANLYDRANHFRRNNEFDKAAGIYEQILNEDTADAEAYWSLVLCRYGIEYVEDPATHRRVPTVNRAQFTSVFDDDNYKSALRYADGYQRAIYEAEANAINEIQKGILAISQKEDPFDVFICYKETDNSGRRTRDSVLANDLYHQLTQEGFKVFFSRITLEDKLGTAYEPYIFAALNSAKVMVVLGTKPEYFGAVWVKNEWSRYLSLVKQSGGKKVLIPAYRDMDPYDLPEEFSHLQAQDMSKLGFMQDLIRGIRKIVKADESKTAVRETVVVNTAASANVAPLLKRAFMFLEDGNWVEADAYCEKVLDQDPENAQAYLGKLMAELHVRRQEDLPNYEQPFDQNSNYQKVVRFGDRKLVGDLKGFIAHINERNEMMRMTGIYNDAVSAMNTASSESAYQSAAETFKTIPGFKDADILAEQCLEQAEICRKDEIYASAKSRMTGENTVYYETAIQLFESISGWKDTDEQICSCQRKIEEIKVKELEREREVEELRTAAEKKRKIIIAITASIFVGCIVFVIILTYVIIPNRNYNTAVDLYNAGKYDEAIATFQALDGYKDSAAQIAAIKDRKYNIAVDLYNAGKYDEAIAAFQELDSYKDSADQIIQCEDAIIEGKCNAVVDLYNAGKYDKAISTFKSLEKYKASADQIAKCEIEILSKAQVGASVFYGSYEQDNDTSNGKEEIEWLVLAKDGNKVLVVSKFALDCQQYSNEIGLYRFWDNCLLRKWLNETFLSTAFSLEEQNSIITSNITTDSYIGYDTTTTTTDKVFVLSIAEANEYFTSDESRKCAPTDYALAQGVWVSDSTKIDGKATCWWWLRDSESSSIADIACYIDHAGRVNDRGHNKEILTGAVRPALWINLEP